MDFTHYQKQAHTTALYPDDVALAYLMSGLGAEAGEVLGKYAKHLRKDNHSLNTEDIKDELGDVLWFIAEICTHLNISLEDVALHNLEKLASRQKRGQIKGSGDKR